MNANQPFIALFQAADAKKETIMQTSISKRFTKHTLLRSLFSTLLALSSLNHLALAQSPIQPLQNDPAIRQQLNRKNYEPSNTPNPNNLFPFKGHRGTVEHRTGSIRITNNQTTPLGGGVELQQLNYKGEIGFHTRFTNHGWKSHSPFDGRASKTGYGKGQSISDGYGPSSYAYTIQGTMVHPADGYEAPQGGGYPAPSKYGAHDRYNIKVSGQARRMVQKPLDRNFGWKQAWENTKHAGRTGIENAIHAGRKMDTRLVTYDRNQGFWTNSQTNIRNMLGRMNGKIEGALLIPSMGLHTAVGAGSATVDSYQYNRDYQNYKKDIQQQKNMDERTLFWHLYGMGEQYTQKQLGKEPLKQVGQDIAEKANNFAQKYPTTTEAAELGFNLWGAGVVGKNSVAAVARSGADDFAGAVAARAAQQVEKKLPDGMKGTSNDAIRDWYNAQVAPDRIAALNKKWEQEGISLAERAKRTYDIRHDARVTARDYMDNQLQASWLKVRDLFQHGSTDGPSFNKLMNRNKKNGLNQEQSYQQIINSASRTNKKYNHKYGSKKGK